MHQTPNKRQKKKSTQKEPQLLEISNNGYVCDMGRESSWVN